MRGQAGVGFIGMVGLVIATPATAQSARMPASLIWQVTPGSVSETSTPLLTSKLRLRVDTPRPALAHSLRLQQRYASAMIDVFPFDGQGFRFSAGTRYHIRRDFIAEGDGAARGLLFAPHGGGRGGGSGRTGFNRFNPAVTMGYTESLGSRMSLGFELGERMGRAFARGPHLPRLDGERRSGGHDAANDFHPVASLTFGLAF